MPLYIHALHKNACNTTRVTVGILIILKDKWWDPNSPPGPQGCCESGVLICSQVSFNL